MSGRELGALGISEMLSDETCFCVHFPFRYSLQAILISQYSMGLLLFGVLLFPISLSVLIPICAFGAVFFMNWGKKINWRLFQITGIKYVPTSLIWPSLGS